MKLCQATSLVLVALIMLSAPASAQTTPTLSQTKIGVVNVDQILRDSPTAKRVQAKLHEEFAVRDQEISKMIEQTKVMQTHLEINALTMSSEERQKRERELEEANGNLKRKQLDFNADLTKRRQEELAGFVDRITSAVRTLGELEKFDIVVRGAAWVDPRVDITGKVIMSIGEKDER